MVEIWWHRRETGGKRRKQTSICSIGRNRSTRLIKLEKSNPAFRGLSHLEIGQATESLSFLFETPNPGMDRWREKPDVIGDPKYPLEHRVGTALRIFKHLADSYGAKTGKAFVLRGLPEYPEILEKKVGAFLN